MVSLIGIMCFFSHITCNPPTVFGDPFPTMKACEEIKAKIEEVIKPTPWADGKFECQEDQDVT